jgi:hypothetical protein
MTASGSPCGRSKKVIDLFAARDQRRVRVFRSRVQALLHANRRALTQLFASGSLFTRQGARAGRNLLAAHQKLLKVGDLLHQITDLEANGEGAASVELFEQAEALLRRSRELATRTDAFLSTLRR